MCGVRRLAAASSRWGREQAPELHIRAFLASWALLFLVFPPCAGAVELWSDEEGRRYVSLDTALKLTTTYSHAPNAPLLFPDRDSTAILSRLRLNFSAQITEMATAELAYEHRARWDSNGAGALSAGAAVLPSFAEAPYRLAQLDWELAHHGERFAYRHEIDRALVSLHPAWGEVTVGRQAIGLGRGILFSAVDLFSPFSPVEVDREWRRGVDALRIEYRTTDTSSIEFIGAFGERWDESAVLGRIRGYMGDVDGEFLFGKRGEDILFGGSVSAVVGDAEVHGEFALFRTPEAHPDGGFFESDRWVAKAVLGTSYTFDVGNGLTVLGEYHYSGFGMRDSEDSLLRLRDEDFVARYLRGDSQILGRHALALQSTYPISDSWNAALLVLGSPRDGSGLVSPSLIWDFWEGGSLIVSGFVPWGSEPSSMRLRSEYGASPASLFVQMSLYF